MNIFHLLAQLDFWLDFLLSEIYILFHVSWFTKGRVLFCFWFCFQWRKIHET